MRKSIGKGFQKVGIFLLTLLLLCGCGSMEVFADELADTLVVSTLSSSNFAGIKYAKGYAVIDADNGRLLDSKEAMLPLANASTTKILACIIALEKGNLEDVVIPSKNACSQPKVRLGLSQDDSYVLEDLLYGMMLESYNDCAVAVAEHILGSEEAFCEEMNKKAIEIGCFDTFFVTPNGLDGESDGREHHSTAYDLCQIMRYCCFESTCKEQFIRICSTKNKSISSGNGKSYAVLNKNPLLDAYEDMIAGKTGYTAKAGYCYVCAFETSQGQRFCMALLGCGWPNHKNYRLEDTRRIYDYISTSFQMTTISNLVPTFPTIEQRGYYIEGKGKTDWLCVNCSVPLDCPEEKIPNILLSAKDEVEIKEEYFIENGSCMEIKNSRSAGRVNYYVNGQLFGSIPLEYKEKTEKWTFFKVLVFLLKKFCVFSLIN